MLEKRKLVARNGSTRFKEQMEVFQKHSSSYFDPDGIYRRMNPCNKDGEVWNREVVTEAEHLRGVIERREKVIKQKKAKRRLENYMTSLNGTYLVSKSPSSKAATNLKINKSAKSIKTISVTSKRRRKSKRQKLFEKTFKSVKKFKRENKAWSRSLFLKEFQGRVEKFMLGCAENLAEVSVTKINFKEVLDDITKLKGTFKFNTDKSVEVDDATRLKIKAFFKSEELQSPDQIINKYTQIEQALKNMQSVVMEKVKRTCKLFSKRKGTNPEEFLQDMYEQLKKTARLELRTFKILEEYKKKGQEKKGFLRVCQRHCNTARGILKKTKRLELLKDQLRGDKMMLRRMDNMGSKYGSDESENSFLTSSFSLGEDCEDTVESKPKTKVLSRAGFSSQGRLRSGSDQSNMKQLAYLTLDSNPEYE